MAQEVYAELFEPVFGVSFTHPGVFCTPIDFSLLPQSLLADRPRIVLPVDSLDPVCAALTWLLDGRRVRHRLSPASLNQASAIWIGSV